MAKNKKKRNKIYTGVDAAITKPVITKITATNRSKLGQWWFERKATIKPLLITIGVAILIIILVVQVVRIVSGS